MAIKVITWLMASSRYCQQCHEWSRKGNVLLYDRILQQCLKLSAVSLLFIENIKTSIVGIKILY